MLLEQYVTARYLYFVAMNAELGYAVVALTLTGQISTISALIYFEHGWRNPDNLPHHLLLQQIAWTPLKVNMAT
jgi:hypothetical protein